MSTLLTLADRLRDSLERASKTPADLAKAAGISGSSVSDLLSGQSKTMKARTLLLAAQLLEVRPWWLLEGKGPRAREAGDLVPHESASVYQVNAWPFKRIAAEQFNLLEDGDRAFVEGQLAAAIAQCLTQARPAQGKRQGKG